MSKRHAPADDGEGADLRDGEEKRPRTFDELEREHDWSKRKPKGEYFAKQSKGKDIKFLEPEEIEGAEAAPNVQYEGDTKITPFNLDEELEKGNFDESGHYIEKEQDPEESLDNWLTDIKPEDMEKAREAHDKLLLKMKEAKDVVKATKPSDKKELLTRLSTYIVPNETVSKALRRLGSDIKAAKNKKSTGKIAVDVQSKKETLDAITEISDQLIGIGYFDVYTKTREQLLSEIEGEAPVVPSSYGFGTPKSEHNQEPIVYWEYRWEPSGEIYGPFAAKEMQAWMDQGYFNQGIFARIWKGDDNAEQFSPLKDISFFASRTPYL